MDRSLPSFDVSYMGANSIYADLELDRHGNPSISPSISGALSNQYARNYAAPAITMAGKKAQSNLDWISGKPSRQVRLSGIPLVTSALTRGLRKIQGYEDMPVRINENGQLIYVKLYDDGRGIRGIPVDNHIDERRARKILTDEILRQKGLPQTVEPWALTGGPQNADLGGRRKRKNRKSQKVRRNRKNATRRKR